jgi:GNAT superfamily N-acetyltransferase
MLTCHDTIPGLDPIAPSATSHVHWQHAVREIAPCELGRFEFHLLRLDARCRRLRFSSPVPDDYIRAYVRGISVTTSVTLGCFINGWLRGAAELRSPDANWGTEAEIAFSVERAWQGRGIGTALMASVIEAAKIRGIERLQLSFSSVNHRMGAIARKVAVSIDMADDECVANVNLLPDSAAAA